MSNAEKTFDTPEPFLEQVLKQIKAGEVQLPDFQRGWVWDDDHIKSLLASVSLSFPIGSVMMLETGNDDVRFRPRLVTGVQNGNGNAVPNPEMLILDGQQRLTSLFLSLFSGKPVETVDARKKKIIRWYYIDMAKALKANGDREEAIVSVPEDKITRTNFQRDIVSDYSSNEGEYAALVFPLAKVFDYSEWANGFRKFWNYDAEKVSFLDRFEQAVLKRFDKYQIPVIKLFKSTPKEAVCQVFEKVNTGGVTLTVFELLTATFAADDFRLREDWEARDKRLLKAEKNKVLQGLSNDDFLQAVTLLATHEKRLNEIKNGNDPENAPAISCKRREILRLTLSEYKAWADSVTEGFEHVARLLRGEKIFEARDVPYRTQLVPLAAVFTLIGGKIDDTVRNKLLRWYWSGVFGELYSSAVETRFARDLPELLDWIKGGPEPLTVREANFVPNRLLTLKSRNSAAYKGLSALLLRDGGLDFISGEAIDVQMYADEKIDIHHIFPRDWCDKQKVKIDQNRRDCVVNKTPLSAHTNRKISNNAPSAYLTTIQNECKIATSRMDEILQSHVIDPTAIRTDNFEAFFQRRFEALLQRIEKAMGKPIQRDLPADFEMPDQFETEPEELEVQSA
jgi:hypothetical protein